MGIIHGDCLEKLREMADNSVDSIVTDPPYGLKFMGKKWDYEVPTVDVWRECLRVLKPGGHALIACGTRTQHRMAVNIEDAGFEIREVISYLYGSGFPKSLNVAKSARSAGIGCECKSTSQHAVPSLPSSDVQATISTEAPDSGLLQSSLPKLGLSEFRTQGTEPQSSNGKESSLEGWRDVQAQQGQLRGSKVREVSEAMASNGTQGRLHNGASSRDGEASESVTQPNRSGASQRSQHAEQFDKQSGTICDQRRAQTCGSCGKTIFDPGLGTALKPACEFWTLARKPLGESTVAKNVKRWGTGGLNIDGCRIEASQDYGRSATNSKGTVNAHDGFEGKSFKIKERDGDYASPLGRFPANLILDEEAAALLGEPSRFFYTAKASKSERNAGCEGLPEKYNDFQRESSGLSQGKNPETGERSGKRLAPNANHHPTVKPIKLMAYLCRLITPPKGLVLDPFMGSGSTGVAARDEGFDFIGIEREAEYVEIARKRLGI